LPRQASGVGTQLTDRQARGFVDVQRDVAQLLDGFGQAWPFFIGQGAGAQMGLVNPADGTDNTHRQLRGTHLHREHRHRQAFVEGHVFGDVDGQRGLSHGGPCRQDHQVAGLEARGHLVQIVKTRRHTGHIIRVLRHLGHAIQQAHHQGVHALEALLHA